MTDAALKVCLCRMGDRFPLPWRGRSGSFEGLLGILGDDLLEAVYLLLRKQPLKHVE